MNTDLLIVLSGSTSHSIASKFLNLVDQMVGHHLQQSLSDRLIFESPEQFASYAYKLTSNLH